MRVADSHWMRIEEYLRHDDRAVLPLGCTEQHAYLSLATDSVLAERVACEAAEPLSVPVFPALAYGFTPAFTAYPGTVTLRLATFLDAVRDLLDGLADSGFKRILIVNGHGGNTPAESLVAEWMTRRAGVRVRFHNWWSAPATMAQVRAIDPIASHASWMENFPWTRLAGVTSPTHAKPMIDVARLRGLSPRETRDALGDGNFGGRYQRDDDDLARVWRVAVEETRERLTEGW